MTCSSVRTPRSPTTHFPAAGNAPRAFQERSFVTVLRSAPTLRSFPASPLVRQLWSAPAPSSPRTFPRRQSWWATRQESSAMSNRTDRGTKDTPVEAEVTAIDVGLLPDYRTPKDHRSSREPHVHRIQPAYPVRD